MIAEFPDPGRLPAIAATVEQDLATARANPRNLDMVEEPSAAELACCGVSRPVSPAARSASTFTSRLNTVKTHTRELYRKLDASSREDAVAGAEALGLLDLIESPG